MRILHIFRAPLGGLFRHVCDLAAAQADAGLETGLICDSEDANQLAEDRLTQLETVCALGIHRIPMARQIGFNDLSAFRRVSGLAQRIDADILHGHGAKGGAYARFAKTNSQAKRFYTPHGGSLHYRPGTPAGLVFLTLERILMRRTDGLIFESRYAMDQWSAKIGTPACPTQIIHNGLHAAEFEPVGLVKQPRDFLFVGELRALKGVEIFIKALGLVNRQRSVTALIVGSGSDRDYFTQLSAQLGLEEAIQFATPMPARTAFVQARHLVVPSLKESFPYIVLEAAAAGKDMTATRVGGIPEIYGKQAERLVPPGNEHALATALLDSMNNPKTASNAARTLRKRVASHFTVDTMARGITQFYHDRLSPSRSPALPDIGTAPPARLDQYID